MCQASVLSLENSPDNSNVQSNLRTNDLVIFSIAFHSKVLTPFICSPDKRLGKEASMQVALTINRIMELLTLRKPSTSMKTTSDWCQKFLATCLAKLSQALVGTNIDCAINLLL